MLKRLRPDCLPEVSDEDERVWESQEGGKRSAMENLWIRCNCKGGDGIDKEAESIENDQELIKPLMLGGWSGCWQGQSRGWSRIRTSCDGGRNDCA